MLCRQLSRQAREHARTAVVKWLRTEATDHAAKPGDTRAGEVIKKAVNIFVDNVMLLEKIPSEAVDASVDGDLGGLPLAEFAARWGSALRQETEASIKYMATTAIEDIHAIAPWSCGSDGVATRSWVHLATDVVKQLFQFMLVDCSSAMYEDIVAWMNDSARAALDTTRQRAHWETLLAMVVEHQLEKTPLNLLQMDRPTPIARDGDDMTDEGTKVSRRRHKVDGHHACRGDGGWAAYDHDSNAAGGGAGGGAGAGAGARAGAAPAHTVADKSRHSRPYDAGAAGGWTLKGGVRAIARRINPIQRVSKRISAASLATKSRFWMLLLRGSTARALFQTSVTRVVSEIMQTAKDGTMALKDLDWFCSQQRNDGLRGLLEVCEAAGVPGQFEPSHLTKLYKEWNDTRSSVQYFLEHWCSTEFMASRPADAPDLVS